MALAVFLTVILAGFVIVLLRSSTPGCTVAVDRPALPASLSALGDFQQPYSAADVATLQDVAARAASAVDPSLIGAAPQAVVTVAGTTGHPTALVVPLRSATAGSPAIVGLAVFEEDCAGNAFFEQLEDDATTQPPLLAFPPVSRAAAVASLRSSSLTLEWSASPLRPVWVAATSPVASMAAR